MPLWEASQQPNLLVYYYSFSLFQMAFPPWESSASVSSCRSQKTNRDRKCHHSFLKRLIPDGLSFFNFFFLIYHCDVSYLCIRRNICFIKFSLGMGKPWPVGWIWHITLLHMSYELIFLHFIRQHSVMCWMHGCQKFLKSPVDLQYFFTRPPCVFSFHVLFSLLLKGRNAIVKMHQ